MKPVFISILNEKEIIVKDSIEELAAIPHLEMYLKKELHFERKNNFGNTEYFYKYTPIDKQGKRKVIDVGQFEITDISPEILRSVEVVGKRIHFVAMDIVVHDKSKNVNNKYYQNLPSKNFIIEELLPLINILRTVSDWDLFMNLKRIPMLELEITGLKEKVASQNQKIKKLRQPK